MEEKWENVTEQCNVFGDGVHEGIGIGIPYRNLPYFGLMPLMTLHRDHYMGEDHYNVYRIRVLEGTHNCNKLFIIERLVKV
jgi:hypothetical protein